MTRPRSPAFLLASIAACILSTFDAAAQGYPVKPVRLLVGFGPGGTDTAARVFSQRFSEALGQNVIVENRPGAAGAIAIERVATSPPDGYNLLLMPASGTIVSALRTNLPYDLERDLAPISLIALQSLVLVVHPSVPARNVKELIALARARPGQLSYGSNGVGSVLHFAAELFNSMANVKIVHIPYKGSAESAIAILSGQIEMSYPGLASALPYLESGRLRGLAVSSAKRSSLIPTLPTVDESGLPGYESTTWFGVAAPSKTPREIIAQLSAAIHKVINTPEMKSALNKQGLEAQTNTQEQFAALIRKEIAQNAKLIKTIGLKPE
jgi:tripartite-type tricarboxylate transporter receptor subunit TctC